MDIVFSIVVGILMLTAFVVIHEFGHYFAAKKCGIAVEEFSIGFGPKIAQWSSRDRLSKISLRLILFGGYVRFVGEEEEDRKNPKHFLGARLWKRFVTVLAGPAMNIVAAFLIAVVFLCAYGDISPVVESVAEGSAAQAAGLLPGDVITEMNGIRIELSSVDFPLALENADYKNMQLTVDRGGQELDFSVPYELQEDGTYKIGISSFSYQRHTFRFFEAIGLAFRWLGMITMQLLDVLGNLFFRGQGVENFAGMVGTINIIGTVAKTGLENILRLASLISVNLAIINLLPIPALDGGKVVLYTVEGIRKKPVSMNVEGVLNFIGFAVIIGFAIFLTFQDIGRLMGN